jgi:hypothetical protein
MGNSVQVWDGMPVARSLDEFAAGVRRIKNFVLEWEFRLGEWLNANKAIHHDLIWQWVDELPYTHAQISNFMWVAKEIGDQYTPEIKWSWWQSIAGLPEEKRSECITRALGKTIDREGIRALGTKNGSAGLKTQMAAIPTERERAESDLAKAYVHVGWLQKHWDSGPDYAAALDELIECAMALREKLA